jgi:hypothetical protein
MLQFVHILLLSLHLICMNVGSGAPLLCAWLEWKLRNDKTSSEGAARQAADYLAAMTVLALVAGSLLGLVMGIMLWTPEYSAVWTKRLSHKMHWGGAELLVSLGVLGGYWFWRKRSRGGSMASAICRIFLLLFASTNLLYHFPPLFFVAGKLADGKDAGGQAVQGKVFVQEMLSGEIPALWVHFTLASLAMAGVMLLGLALRLRRQGAPEEEAARVAIWGGWWGLVPSILQLPVGLWVMTALPAASQSRIMGSSGVATVFFLAGIVAALWLLRELVSIALGETSRGNLIRAMSAMVLVVFLMTGTHQCAKDGAEDTLKSMMTAQKNPREPSSRVSEFLAQKER